MSLNKNYFISFMVWLSITMFYCYQYILRMIPNLIMPELMSRFNIGASEFGTFASIYYIGYITISIPIGLALSRFGGKLVLPICITLTTLGLIPLAYSNDWTLVLLGRLFVGIGSSAAIVGALQIFKIVFPEHFTRMLGIMVCFGLMTVVYSSSPLSQTINAIGLSTAVNILTISGLTLAILTFFLVPKTSADDITSSAWTDIKMIIYNYKLIFVSILAGLMIGPLEGFADAWGNGFLGAVYNIERVEAGNIISYILTGMCAGCIILPFIADRTNSYYSLTLASAIIMATCFMLLLSAYGSVCLLKAICLIIGIFCAYQVVIIAKISTYVPENLSGMAAAVANMIMMAFGSIFHTLIGTMMEHTSDNTVVDGVRVYSAETYINGISVIPFAMIIAAIGFVVLIIGRKYKKKSSYS